MFDEKKKAKIIRTIKKELKMVPDYNPDLQDINQRTNKYEDILPEVFWNIYGEPNFTNREMRKLDLSKLSFENEFAEGFDFSYTNINLDPTKVRNKSIDYANFEGTDLSMYTLDGVSVIDTNLTNSKVKVDLDKIARYSRRTKLKGCFILESSFLGKIIPYSVLEGSNMVDSFQNEKPKILTKRG